MTSARERLLSVIADYEAKTGHRPTRISVNKETFEEIFWDHFEVIRGLGGKPWEVKIGKFVHQISETWRPGEQHMALSLEGVEIVAKVAP